MKHELESTPRTTTQSILPTSRASITPPTTPTTPTTVTATSCERSCFDDTTYSVEQTLAHHRYKSITKITKTLQGSIWQALKNEKMYIIKVTNKSLHQNHITYYNGQKIHISENVIKEASILQYLSKTNPPKSLVKYVDFFYDKFNYIFVMQYGGEMSLFEFVKKCHKYINMGVITFKEWHKVCQIAMRQMIQLVDWLHKMNVCHLDISLENFVIDNVMVEENVQTKTIKILPGFQVRIIDFGLAEVFYKKNQHNETDFLSDKFVGKTLYKSNQVYEKKERFDARSADIWSLSVVFFIMLIGCPPYARPSLNDIGFKLIMNGHLFELLQSWGKFKTITPNAFSLLELLFQQKLTIKDIGNHPFLM